MLIVEDNLNLGFGLHSNFEQEGFEVETVGNGLEADERLAAESFDIVLLDLKLPGMHGLEVLARMRKRGDQTPVLIVSALDKEPDVLEGFRLGADDYVTKSALSIPVLIARAHALLRRSRLSPTQPGLRLPAVPLTPREIEVGTLVRDGLSDKAIARRLGIQVHTVKIHVHHILRKFGFHRRKDLAAAQLPPAEDRPGSE